MNQKELVAAVAAASGQSKNVVEQVLKGLDGVVKIELQTGGDVTLPGIGKLSVKHRPARTGRNPKTGESIEIAAKRLPEFTAAKALKDLIA